jgi:hypothetical protein
MFEKKYSVATIFLLISLLLSSCENEETGPVPGPGIPVDSIEIMLLNDTFEDQPLILAGSTVGDFIVAYYRIRNDDTLHFSPATESLPALMKDNYGNVWDLFGEAISGPWKGDQLEGPDQFNGFWFAWGTFFPDVEIYSENDIIDQPDREYSDGAWLIPSHKIRDGGPGKDGIPYLTDPEMKPPGEINYLKNNDLILGVKTDGKTRGYPHNILDWHEIINDNLGDHRYAITYCPLTGTGIGWNRRINDQVNSFGVSGLLYNTNLLPYDRNTDSYWSQIRMECVFGELKGERIKSVPVIEMNWAAWKSIFPESKVVTKNTGHSRNYERYPYGSYKTNNSLIFPVDIEDRRLPMKEIVHGIIINDKARVYQFSDFTDN